MKQTRLKINKLVNNSGQIDGVPKNPRQINKEDYQKLIKSLKEDPTFMEHKPLHVFEHNENYVVLGGNMRLKALKELGWEDVPVTIYDPSTPPELLRRRVIVDNSTYGLYDMDSIANEWSDEPLADWGVILPKYSEQDFDTGKEIDPEGLLNEKIVVCPRCKFEFNE